MCVGWFLVGMLIWALIIGMNTRSVGCEGIYMFIMSSGASGLLDIERLVQTMICYLVWGFW